MPTTWRTSIQLSASVDAEQDATLAAAQNGRVTAVLFQSGQDVPAGAVLVQLDNGPAQAQLALDEARLSQAARDLGRQQKLMTISGSSEAALEQAEADQTEAKAQVTLDDANLAQLQITAPFAGTLGIRKISAGDYLSQGAAVVTLTQTAPLRVLFAVPQTEAGRMSVGDPFTLKAPDAAGNPVAVDGKITALSPSVTQATNARDAEGILTSGQDGLLPGMFGTVTLQTGAPQPAFAVPSTALNDNTLGPFLFVLKSSGAAIYTLQTVYVTILGDAGTQSFVAAPGLQAGQKVLAIGGFKLTDGASVTLQSP